MRCSSILLLLICWLCGMLNAASVSGQSLRDVYISIDLQQSNLKESLLELQKKSSMRIAFDADLVNNKKNKINLSEQRISLEQALNCVLMGTGLRYREVNDFVVIQAIPAQTRITGQVLDADGETTLAGVSIRMKGSGTGTTSDANGYFSITK